jgi:hypothetical protein
MTSDEDIHAIRLALESIAADLKRLVNATVPPGPATSIEINPGKPTTH